jgi:hypothetical protein
MNAKDCQEQQYENIILNIEKAIKKEVETGSSDCIFYEDLYRFYSRREDVLSYFRNLGFRINQDCNTSRIEIRW